MNLQNGYKVLYSVAQGEKAQSDWAANPVVYGSINDASRATETANIVKAYNNGTSIINPVHVAGEAEGTTAFSDFKLIYAKNFTENDALVTRLYGSKSTVPTTNDINLVFKIGDTVVAGAATQAVMTAASSASATASKKSAKSSAKVAKTEDSSSAEETK